jgi:redox-regulated HSP33 family molecular chaperone
MERVECTKCRKEIPPKFQCECSKSALSGVLRSLVDKWGNEMLRLEEEAKKAPNRLEATAYRATALKIADFLDDLDRLETS